MTNRIEITDDQLATVLTSLDFVLLTYEAKKLTEGAASLDQDTLNALEDARQLKRYLETV